MSKICKSTDGWEPTISQQSLEARAKAYAQIRDFFVARKVLEVETPVIQAAAVTDLHLECMRVCNANSELFLHTSPEYAMKRMLAYYQRDIYQICKVFRAAEEGRYHHPEFTMLEWYRVGWDYQKLMREVEELVKVLSKDKINFPKTIYTRYQELFIDYCELDLLQADRSDYISACEHAEISLAKNLSIQNYQELLLDQAIAPQFPKNQLTFVYEFPAQQAALAKINDKALAERFELYLGRIELANGFQELTDADQQLKRFESDNLKRKQNNREQIKIDKKFIDSLKAGLPESAGVALGVDRLLMLLLGVNEINEVLAFPDL